MPKDVAIYKGDNIRDKKLVDATSADTVSSGDSIIIKTVSGDYVEVDMNSFTNAVKGVLGKLVADNDKGTNVSGITVTDGNDDLGSVTPQNFAIALNDYISGTTPTLQAAAGANISSVGTPSVTASTVGSTTTFTFNYLKGATGAQGPQGPQGATGPKGATGPQGPAGTSSPSWLNIQNVVVGSNEFDICDTKPGSSRLWFNYTGRNNGNFVLDNYYMGNGRNMPTAGVYAGSYNNGSDIRNKIVVENVDLSLEDISKAPLFKFYWKEGYGDSAIHVGTSAQYWKAVLPEITSEQDNEQKTMSVSYDVAALASVISLAKKVKELEEEIKNLKEK